MLPFEKIRKYMVVYMGFNAMIVMNLFPMKGDNQHYSLQATMNGQGVSVENLKILFGSYMQVTNATYHTTVWNLTREKL